MHERDIASVSSQSCGQNGVGVSLNDDCQWGQLCERIRQPTKCKGYLSRTVVASDLKSNFRVGESETCEKDLR
jgi:hypothetical protein